MVVHLTREWDTRNRRVTEMEAEAAAAGPSSATSQKEAPADTPYSTPGGRWGKFKKYSVWQVSPAFPTSLHVSRQTL